MNLQRHSAEEHTRWDRRLDVIPACDALGVSRGRVDRGVWGECVHLRKWGNCKHLRANGIRWELGVA